MMGWRIVLMQWDRKLGWWRRIEPTERIDLRILARERAAKRKAKPEIHDWAKAGFCGLAEVSKTCQSAEN